MGNRVYNEEEYLLISGIQHFAFCRRQWALIHIEKQWDENTSTMYGQIFHANSHNPFSTEKRGDLIITRNIPIYSRNLGVWGVCDVVEFYQDKEGVKLFGRDGLWLPKPVEYKSGKPKIDDADKLQLCSQAICLEEMLLCKKMEYAYLFYGKSKRREIVYLTEELRDKVQETYLEMRSYYDRFYTPRVKATNKCRSCSLLDYCLPKLPQEGTVKKYLDSTLEREE